MVVFGDGRDGGDEKTALPEGKSGLDFVLRGERWCEI